MSNPLMKLEVSGRKTMSDPVRGIHHYSLSTKLDNEEILGTDLDINKPDSKAEMIITTKGNISTLHLSNILLFLSS